MDSGTRVYLAARFARREELRAIATDLSDIGFVVTSRWLEGDEPLSNADLTSNSRAADLALMDLEDLRRSDLCLAFTESPDEPRAGRGGRHTELGVAIGLGIEAVLVGPREHVFHALPAIRQYPDWPAARQGLTTRHEGVLRLVAG